MDRQARACSPSKVSGRSGLHRDVAAALPPLVRLAALQSVVSNRPVTHRVCHARHDLVVSDGKNGFYRLPSAAHFRERFHPLVSFAPLQSSPGPACPARRNAGATFLGVAASLIATSAGSNARRVPSFGALRPRRFSRPRRFTSLPTWWVCFTPLPRPGFPPSGVLSLAKPETPRRRPVPSRRWLGSAASGFPSAPRHRTPPSGLCSLRGPVAPTSGFSRRTSPIPSWCSSSSRFSFAAPRDRLRDLHRSWSCNRVRRVVPCRDLQRLRRRARLSSLEVADLLEVLCLPHRRQLAPPSVARPFALLWQSTSTADRDRR